MTRIIKNKTIFLAFFLFFLASKRVVLAKTDYFLDRPLEIEILENGNFLVADGGGWDWTNQGSELLIINRNKEIIWNFKDSLVFAHSAHRFSNGEIVITDTTNDRIIAVDKKAKKIIWTSQDWGGGTGKLSDGSKLDYPNEALETDNKTILVTDRNNDRVLEIEKDGQVLWQYKGLKRPHNASQIEENEFLVSDSEKNRVIIINRKGQILWQFDGGEEKLNWPRDVEKINNGNFLITDTRNHRVVEITESKEKVWEFKDGLYWPYEAERLENGNTLICDSQNRRVIEISPDKKVVWHWRLGEPAKPGRFENGSFEKEESGFPKGWIKADLLAEGEGKFSLDGSQAYDGQKSARLDYQGEGFIFWLQRISVIPGQKYQLSGFVKTDLEEDGRSWARYELWWENENGGFVGQPLVSSKSEGKLNWTKREWSGAAPQGAIAVNIRALMTGSGTTWFDDIVWQEEKAWGNKQVFYFVLGFVAAVSLIKAAQLIKKIKRKTKIRFS